MNEHKVRLIERIKRTPTVESFRFKPEKKLEFIPGQFARIIFDRDNPSNKDLNKYLSFSSSPDKDYLEFTKRISRSEFSGRLTSLRAGDEILIQGPMGSCVLKPEYKKIAFLIGGIGITPVISIVEYVTERSLDTDVYLLYSNRTEEEILFYQELKSWEAANPNIKVCYTVTDCAPQERTCIQGRICKDLFLEQIKDSRDRTFFIFGPPKMVEAMKTICSDVGVKPEQVRTESFIGY